MMGGASLMFVQRVMRHSDPKVTASVYGHLSTDYLTGEIDRLSFIPKVVDADLSGFAERFWCQLGAPARRRLRVVQRTR